MVAVLNFNRVYLFWSFLTGEPLLTNWLPWQQRNIFLQFMKFKILLKPSWEKLQSFKVMACSPFWSSETFTGLEVENTPGAYRVKAYLRSLVLFATFYSFFQIFLDPPS